MIRGSVPRRKAMKSRGKGATPAADLLSCRLHHPERVGYKTLKYKCGNTGVDGNPVLCDACAEEFKDRDWRREAEENGEVWDEEGY